MEEQVWRVREIAKLLNVTRETILKLLQQGTLRGFKVGRDWRVTQTELDRFMQQRPPEPPAEESLEEPEASELRAIEEAISPDDGACLREAGLDLLRRESSERPQFLPPIPLEA
jgi:excisionase family DNA binding protein